MNVVELRWQRYRIPFRRPIVTGHGELRFREGAIVELVTDCGITGLGEIAPPPQLGQSLDEAMAALTGVTLESCNRPVEWVLDALTAPGTDRYGLAETPSVWCALEMALLDALGKEKDKPLSALLYRNSSSEPPRLSIPVNAVVGASSVEDAVRFSQEAVARGFCCIKLKVGINGDVGREVERISAVSEAIGPHVHLRLDANASWEYQQALAILSHCSPSSIQYVEQPLPAADLSGMRALGTASSIPIAADEALHDQTSLIRILMEGLADVFVLKPQAIGCLLDCQRTIRAAAEREIHCVVTSSMEAGVGVAAALHLAAAEPSITLECGLATLDLLEDDLIVEPPRIERGMMLVPPGPGLGVALDREALARYAVP